MQTKVITPSTQNNIQREISEQVNARGFYLYKWISPSELRTSIKADYLSLITNLSIPIAIVTFIAGVVGLTGGIMGVIIGILFVLSIFYSIILLILIVKMLYKSYLYARGADIVITDNHYISSGKILQKSDFEGQKSAFHVMETMFREPVFQQSKLDAYTDIQKKNLFEKLKVISSGAGKIIERTRGNRNNGNIALLVFVVAFFYSLVMGGVYFFGVLFVSILAQFFSWIAHRILLIAHNTEHLIQSSFHEIYEASIKLKKNKKETISLLSKAQKNEWIDNLSGNIHTAFKELNIIARDATKKSIGLRKRLKKSKYNNIFNFAKYDTWIKNQVLSPIDEILELLKNNKNIITKTLSKLNVQLSTNNVWSNTGEKAIEIQKVRLDMQLESIENIISLLQKYKQKLQ